MTNTTRKGTGRYVYPEELAPADDFEPVSDYMESVMDQGPTDGPEYDLAP